MTGALRWTVGRLNGLVARVGSDRSARCAERIDYFALGQNVAKAGLSDVASHRVLALVAGPDSPKAARTFDEGRRSPPEHRGYVNVEKTEATVLEDTDVDGLNATVAVEGWRIEVDVGRMALVPLEGSTFDSERQIATFVAEKAFAFCETHMAVVRLARLTTPELYVSMLPSEPVVVATFKDVRPGDEDELPSLLRRSVR